MSFGLEESFTLEQKKEIEDNVEHQMVSKDLYNEVKNLEKDKNMYRDDQQYVIISYIGPTLTAKSGMYGFRIMGAFASIEDATKYVKTLKETKYDTYIVEMYNFVFTYPDFNEEASTVDSRLNAIIVDHLRTKETREQEFNYRKSLLMANKDRTTEAHAPAISTPSFLYADTPSVASAPVATPVIPVAPAVARTTTSYNPTISTIPLDLKRAKSRIHGQKYAAVCYVGNTGKNQRVVHKIKGVFHSEEACNAYCKQLMEEDDSFDIVTTELYRWLPSDPDFKSVRTTYREDKLNTLFEAHGKASENVKAFNRAVDKETRTPVPTIDSAPVPVTPIVSTTIDEDGVEVIEAENEVVVNAHVDVQVVEEPAVVDIPISVEEPMVSIPVIEEPAVVEATEQTHEVAVVEVPTVVAVVEVPTVVADVIEESEDESSEDEPTQELEGSESSGDDDGVEIDTGPGTVARNLLSGMEENDHFANKQNFYQ